VIHHEHDDPPRQEKHAQRQVPTCAAQRPTRRHVATRSLRGGLELIVQERRGKAVPEPAALAAAAARPQQHRCCLSCGARAALTPGRSSTVLDLAVGIETAIRAARDGFSD
jgi:hypothetical protein